jgi:hypothetical protein
MMSDEEYDEELEALLEEIRVTPLEPIEKSTNRNPVFPRVIFTGDGEARTKWE